MKHLIPRRRILQGAGVALALPWMESLAPRAANALGPVAPRRYVALYFPNGTASYWRPQVAGAADAWKLSPILEPLLSVKASVNVLSNMGNLSPWGVSGPDHEHANFGASTWTATKPHGPGDAYNGISIDQAIAKIVGAETPLPSIQVGLSTRYWSDDQLPGQHSRSMAWQSETEPLYKVVNPQAVFDRLLANNRTPGMALSPADEALAARRRALKKSALDAVLEMSTSLQRQMSVSDVAKMDQVLTSVRALEVRASAPQTQVGGGAGCALIARPSAAINVDSVPPGYNRDEHAKLMIDLVVMAFQCDITRVVSFMLDDARSEFVYDFLSQRSFTSTGSTQIAGTVGDYHELQHSFDENPEYATIGHWNSQKAAELAGKLSASSDGNGTSVLNNTVITFASGMHGGNHEGHNIPVALIGGGGGVLKQNQHVLFASEQELADVHFTILKNVFGSPEPSFGSSRGVLPELLA